MVRRRKKCLAASVLGFGVSGFGSRVSGVRRHAILRDEGDLIGVECLNQEQCVKRGGNNEGEAEQTDH